jgi:uncharacterized protein (TIGR00290 family)
MKEKIVFCWSGGKDSAFALYRLLQDERYEVVSLLTTCNEHFRRVSMHGVRLELLDAQAAAIGLPLEKVFVSERSSNEEYEEKMAACLQAHKARGVSGCAFGDIFLEDLRQWREANLARVGLSAIFPLWKMDTRQLMREFLALGFGTIICCANDAYLGEDIVGRPVTAELVASFPDTVDACGENGEFHSFAYAGPVFKQPIRFTIGEKVYRPLETTHPGGSPSDAAPGKPITRGFWFCDLLPS